MKSCKPSISNRSSLLHHTLSIVEVIATSTSPSSSSVKDYNPLHALEACKDELPVDFLKRLAQRPERLILLQCACRLGCDGTCDCTLSMNRSRHDGILNDDRLWEIQKKKSSSSFIDDDPMIYDPWDGAHLITIPSPPGGSTPPPLVTLGGSGGGNPSGVQGGPSSTPSRCRCDGLPRLTSDVLSALRNVELFGYDKSVEKLSDLFEYDEIRRGERNDYFRDSQFRQPLYRGDVFTWKSVWFDALSAFKDLLNAFYEDKDGKAMVVGSGLMKIFHLELATYLIINLPTRRSLGSLLPYLPESKEAIQEYLSSRNPLKTFLAKLAPLHQACLNDPEGNDITLFCIDLANITAKHLVSTGKRGINRIETLGDALIFATLLGGTFPKLSGSGGRGGVSGGGGYISVSSTRQPRSPPLDIREGNSGISGCFEIRGERLLNFVRACGIQLQQDPRMIKPEGIYQIRDGKVYPKSSSEPIDFFTNFQINKVPWLSATFKDKATFDLGTPDPRAKKEQFWDPIDDDDDVAKDDPLYYLERMEDRFEFSRSKNEGWKALIDQHPYLSKLIDRPRECDHLGGGASGSGTTLSGDEGGRLGAGRFDYDYHCAVNAKRYFDQQPPVCDDIGDCDDDEMRGGWWTLGPREAAEYRRWREGISSNFLSQAAAGDSSAHSARVWPPGYGGDELNLTEAIKLVQKQFDEVKKSASVDKKELKKLSRRFQNLAASFKAQNQNDSAAKSEIENITKAFEGILTKLEYIRFEYLANHRKPAHLNLLDTQNARHYLLYENGIKVLQ